MTNAFSRLALSVAALALLVSATTPCLASKGGTEVSEPVVKDEASPGFTVFGHLPASTEKIVVLAESAQVHVVRSSGIADVQIASNCPHNWNLSGSAIRQAGFAKPRGGVSMLADALGSRAIVNGRIYPLPAGPMHGLTLGKDGVVVGGKKIEPIAGVEMPGTCDGPDAVEVRVPESFTGSLALGVGNGSAVALDSWHGGNLECTLLGDATLSAGKLNSLAKAVVDLRGNGKAEIGDLSTKVLVANVSGSGTLTVKNGSADISNATVSGDGIITLKGKYRNLKQLVEGQGKGSIKVSN